MGVNRYGYFLGMHWDGLTVRPRPRDIATMPNCGLNYDMTAAGINQSAVGAIVSRLGGTSSRRCAGKTIRSRGVGLAFTPNARGTPELRGHQPVNATR